MVSLILLYKKFLLKRREGNHIPTLVKNEIYGRGTRKIETCLRSGGGGWQGMSDSKYDELVVSCSEWLDRKKEEGEP